MRRKYINKLSKKISEHIKSKYELIDKSDMILGDGYFNQRCHANAVQKVKEYICDEVYMIISIDCDNDPIVHFINKKMISSLIIH